MANYSIRDIERLSGIKAHTIRIWEKRYNAIEPKRTDTNIRYYTDDDLKKILNISILNRYGMKISHIMQKSNSEILQAIEELSRTSGHYDSMVESLVLTMIDLDEIRFEKVFTNAIIKLGYETTIVKVIYPLLDKIGILWQIGSIHPAQEHFISNLIRQKLIVAIDAEAKAYANNYKTYILFLPEGELHEFGLLFCYFLLRKAGHKVIYLGQTVPFNDLLQVSETEKEYTLVTSFVTHVPDEEKQAYLNKLDQSFLDKNVYVLENSDKQTSLSGLKNIQFVNSVLEFKRFENLS